MSTPPTPPTPPQFFPPKRKRSTLSKLAIAFAVTIAVTFGLCSIALSRDSSSTISGPVFPAAIIIEALCIIGLIVIFFIAIFRKPQDK
jgi:hypothetical protein